MAATSLEIWERLIAPAVEKHRQWMLAPPPRGAEWLYDLWQNAPRERRRPITDDMVQMCVDLGIKPVAYGPDWFGLDVAAPGADATVIHEITFDGLQIEWRRIPCHEFFQMGRR